MDVRLSGSRNRDSFGYHAGQLKPVAFFSLLPDGSGDFSLVMHKPQLYYSPYRSGAFIQIRLICNYIMGNKGFPESYFFLVLKKIKEE